MDAEHLLQTLRQLAANIPAAEVIRPDGLQRVLNDWEIAARERDRQLSLAAAVDDNRARIEKMERDALIEVQTKFLANTFEKGNAYTNIVILAGYAAFFGLWSLVKDLGSPMNRWAALAMLGSVSLFVVFEFAKMAFLGRQNITRYQLFVKRASQLSFAELKRESATFELDLARQSTNFIRFWLCLVPASALLGLVAVALLGGDLLQAIVASQPPV